ncbi:hypothetical protein [Undibacterium macrobrachii]|uniref:Uncharacterized protein n=1 Tax=Undibacterium macrobrachii TaxID=1119058 RepID=A0ABQ2XLY5_9BURK|nr:hypothetical protein [Undibacterium macrobrachii]GGX23086.1 hypothetical protein GCM10011282_31470 [Undibacterium macrobrachii]
MKQFKDILRLTIISPELLIGCLPFLIYTFQPSLADVFVKPIKESIGFGLGAAMIPLGLLGFCYKEGLDLLAPTGAKKIILEWPDYPMIKARVLAIFLWCVMGSLLAFIAFFMVSTDSKPQLAIAILVAGILSSATATATLALARFRMREIIGE